LKLKAQLDVVKYSFGYNNFFARWRLRGTGLPNVSKYDKVMFALSYSEDSHERVSVNNALMYSSVFRWRRNDIAESLSLRSDAGSAFHVDGPATAKLHGR